MSNEMKMFYCTFGGMGNYPNHVQPILAPNESMAREVMFKVHGSAWMTSYSEDRWNNWLSEKPYYIPDEKELPVLKYDEVFKEVDPS